MKFSKTLLVTILVLIVNLKSFTSACNANLMRCPTVPIKFGIGPACNPASCYCNPDLPKCPTTWNPIFGRGFVCNPDSCLNDPIANPAPIADPAPIAT